MPLTLPSSITGIIFNQQKVVFQNNPPVPSSNPDSNSNPFIQQPFQNIANVLQGNVIGAQTGIVIDATLTESHVLTSEVTTYPIEQQPIPYSPGYAVSDHVQLKPLVYSMTGIISDTPIGFLVLGNLGQVISDVTTFSNNNGGFVGGRSKEAYKAIFDLWSSRIPFTVTTNLKRYTNMIFTNFTVNDDVDSSNAIKFTATLQQVTIVSSQSISSQGQNLASGKTSRVAQVTQNQGTNTTSTQPATILYMATH